ncbi:MAG TPA: N-6 DNA methylase [Chloroflexota bacterium]|nr:N-6 DNA methylase [Chloroflexota bacterium]
MSQTKTRRPKKRQLGQFMTPESLATRLVKQLGVSTATRVLEPSFGDGSFILPLIEEFMSLYQGPVPARLDTILTKNVFGVEVDPRLFQLCLDSIARRWGYLPESHNLVLADFFRHTFQSDTLDNPRGPWQALDADLSFDLVVGNPPFGGTIDPQIQDALDRKYGFRNGYKIKKETYAFFIVKCLDKLKVGGRLLFICSDSFLTIPTMRGLRRLLMEGGTVSVVSLRGFSEETSYPTVLLDVTRSGRSDSITVNGRQVYRSAMETTGNFSWAIENDDARFFAGPRLGDYVICSSGMTIGKNEWFVKDVVGSDVIEHYDYEFFDEPITVAGEIQRARLHTLGARALEKVTQQVLAGGTRRCVRAIKMPTPERVRLPHPGYRFYNKATSGIIYVHPTHAVYWKDDGDAVLTFKKSGNWYLRGVGGKPYFGRAGLTWQLVASRLSVRYLPPGYILDSGSPCAFLRRGVELSELFFILGWTCTELCTRLLKTVINHTQNIQSKDFERLPYPVWVSEGDKQGAISIVRSLIDEAMAGRVVLRRDPEIGALEKLYSYQESDEARRSGDTREGSFQLALW